LSDSSISVTLNTLTKDSQASEVCVYSFHPLVLGELERIFADHGIVPECYRLDSSHLLALGDLPVPSASAYLVEANGRRRATQAIIAEIVSRHPDARLLVVAEEFEEAQAFALLELGTKGFLQYVDLQGSLVRAVREVSLGGFWVSRALLARFVDSTINLLRPQRLIRVKSHLSRREREVHDLLIENYSNKEIARRLHMSERTAKFHVSNLLTKHGVKRRTELILLSFNQSRPA
jgi:DNA-binding NarL/FixJ family response regulator